MVTLSDINVVDIQLSGELPDHMSPYVFFVVFNDTTFIPYNGNETSHVKTHFRFHAYTLRSVLQLGCLAFCRSAIERISSNPLKCISL